MQRDTEVNVLGYRIDHVRFARHDAMIAAGRGAPDLGDWHEVLSPVTHDVLGRFATRAEAERYIVERELASVRVAVERNLA
ncbi:MAG TPA: hypothetical protein VJ696_07985 [Rhodanobacteraceae bacterium]|nr:hypothetical protein [Rhodanobacteraceae bacterium]